MGTNASPTTRHEEPTSETNSANYDICKSLNNNEYKLANEKELADFKPKEVANSDDEFNYDLPEGNANLQPEVITQDESNTQKYIRCESGEEPGEYSDSDSEFVAEACKPKNAIHADYGKRISPQPSTSHVEIEKYNNKDCVIFDIPKLQIDSFDTSSEVDKNFNIEDDDDNPEYLYDIIGAPVTDFTDIDKVEEQTPKQTSSIRPKSSRPTSTKPYAVRLGEPRVAAKPGTTFRRAKVKFSSEVAPHRRPGICLSIWGFLLVFVGIMMLGVNSSSKQYNQRSIQIAGPVCLSIGSAIVIAGFTYQFIVHRKYKRSLGSNASIISNNTTSTPRSRHGSYAQDVYHIDTSSISNKSTHSSTVVINNKAYSASIEVLPDPETHDSVL